MKKIAPVNVYDFDHTIYKGDASLDFIMYCLLRYPKTWKYLPSQALVLIFFVFGLRTRKEVKQVAFGFLKDLENIDEIVVKFWKRHEKNIKSWYSAQRKRSDIIISASPEFLLLPIVRKLNIDVLLATKMDKFTGQINGENCRAKEKVRRLKTYDKDLIIGGVYSDSLSDKPLFKLAKEPYLVKGNKIIAFVKKG